MKQQPATDTTQRKQQMREVMRSRRSSQTPEATTIASCKIQQTILNMPQWQKARQVALYMPIRGEVDTTELLHDAWASHKEVLLPRCLKGHPGVMEFVCCPAADCLVAGSYGILEPLPHLPAASIQTLSDCAPHSFAPQIMLVPGLAFDSTGARLGYGGGYYDRFLHHAMQRQCLCIGMAYQWQVCAHVPTDAWDVALHCLCTEEGLICL